MVFSQQNPPPGFYHYLYLREDGTPYYSGKGKDGRAWASSHTVKPPRDHSRILFTHWGLTEVWALAMERWYIRWYGRKDNGTGILRNMTDGGDGTCGIVVTQEKRDKLSKIPRTDAWRNKTRLARLGKRQSEEVAAKRRGQKRNEETLKIMREVQGGLNNPNSDKTIYIFEHKNGSKEILTRYEMITKYDINASCMRGIIKGERKTAKKWKLIGIYCPTTMS